MFADATAGTFLGESTVVYKTDLRRVFCVFLLAHIASQEREDQYQETQETSKRTKRTEVGTQCLAANPDAPTSGGLPSSEHVQDSEPVLINDHPASSNSKADSVNEESFSPELDLAAFRDVVFEEQESNPGVRYMSESGETTWTPVVNRRNRRRARLADPGSDSSDQRNELQSTIKSARDVTYQCREGVPGLKIRKGCTSSSISWVPIAATPVASRTRSRVRPQ